MFSDQGRTQSDPHHPQVSVPLICGQLQKGQDHSPTRSLVEVYVHYHYLLLVKNLSVSIHDLNLKLACHFGHVFLAPPLFAL